MAPFAPPQKPIPMTKALFGLLFILNMAFSCANLFANDMISATYYAVMAAIFLIFCGINHIADKLENPNKEN